MNSSQSSLQDKPTASSSASRQRIYMDNHATTPLDPRVLEAMMPYLTNEFGNAASRNHDFGWQAEDAIKNARETIAETLGADPREVIFMSGATESINLAILGTAEMLQKKGKHIISSPIEHKAVLDSCHYLEKKGFEVTWLDVDSKGQISLQQLEESIRDDTILVSIMGANNEIGTVYPTAEIGKICADKGVLYHCDATQAYGKIDLDVKRDHIPLLSFSGHKIYGPKGVGALVVSRKNPRVRLHPLIHGGGHERGMRSGTLNVPGIVGLAKAAELIHQERDKDNQHSAALRERLYKKITDEIDYVALNGDPDHHLNGNLNLSFAYVEGESLLMGLEGIAVSSGSACTSASLEPSYVLKALGVSEELAHSSIRYGIGRFNTEADIDEVADRTVQAVKRLREMSPLYEMVQEGIDLETVQWNHH